jgi:hypothetical protein
LLIKGYSLPQTVSLLVGLTLSRGMYRMVEVIQ